MRVRPRLVVLAAAAVVVAGGAQAAIRAGGPACRADVRCETGRLRDGAEWTIQMPRRWNGRLLLFSHGFVAPGEPNVPAAGAIDPVVGDRLLSHGYALAGSSYASVGWAVADAFADQEAVLRRFRREFGAPRATVAWGDSMGGLITAGLLQRHPRQFAGGLAMCGVLGGAVAFWNASLDLAVVFKTLMALDPDRAVARPASRLVLTGIRDARANVADARAALTAAQRTPAGRARIALAAALIDLPGGGDAGWERAQFHALRTQLAFAFGYRQELERRAGGNPSWNTGVDYAAQLRRSADRGEVQALYRAAGLDVRVDLAALAAAPRIRAQARARSYLERNIVFDGALQAPLLTLHTTSDWIVPYQHEQAFAAAVDGAGRGALLRRLYVRRAGHCAFTDAEMLTALRVLFERIDRGRWPRAIGRAALNAAARRLGPAYDGFASSRRAVALKAPPAFAGATPSPLLRRFDLPRAGVTTP
jgi:alpha-beta hydrolase superfamily lysophospholipase